MKTTIPKFIIVPAVLLLLTLSGCGSGGDQQGTAASAGTQQVPAVALAQTSTFGPKKVAIPRGKTTYSYTSTFKGFFNGALGSLKVINGTGVNIPLTPCTGTKAQIKTCKALRDTALAATPTSFEVLINGQVVIAKGSIPRTQGSTTVAIAVNSTNTIKVNLTGRFGEYVTVSATSEKVQPLLNPSANFTFTPTSGTVPVDIVFDGSTSSSPNGSIVSYSWDFGDGATGAGMTTDHVFASAGTFSIVLTVIDSAGKSATKSAAVVISNAVLPVASFTYSVDSSTGALIVSADGSGSSSQNGSIVAYDWSWGDGSPNTSGVTSSHTYALPGSYSVTLTVIDSLGNAASVTQTVTVP